MSKAFELAGEQVLLLPERALLWSSQATLLLADLHLGKDEVFRRSGIAVPAGAVREDLDRLTLLIERYAVRRLVLLGDFVHAAPALDSQFIQHFAQWREKHATLVFTVVAGNHDRRVARATLPMIEWLSEWRLGPFIGRHHPGESSEGYVLCGHMHPVISIRTRRERLRLPVFWFTECYGVLPSFGSFTGGAEIEPALQDAVFAVAPDGVWRLPPMT